jgi:mono/diheme cytochrome c family protein
MNMRRVIALQLVLASIALVPFALIAKHRETKHQHTRVNLIPDMDAQPKFRAQSVNVLFADQRAMRPPVEGTVAWEELHQDDHFYRGVVDGEWATTFPMPVSKGLVARGRERFNIYCAPCHGEAGDGKGIVDVRAERLQEGTWTPPANLHSELVRGRPVGHLFNTISNGIRNMPSYGAQIPEADRWAIVAYVRALQLSQNASIEDVPEEMRSRLR